MDFSLRSEREKASSIKPSASRYLRMAERHLGLHFWALEPESGNMHWFPAAPRELAPMGKRASAEAFISRFTPSEQLQLGVELRCCQVQGKPFDFELQLMISGKKRMYRIWGEREVGSGLIQGGWMERKAEADINQGFSYIVEPSHLRWYYRLFEATNGLLVIAGFDGYFKNISPAWSRVLGYTISELQEKPFVEFVHKDDRESTLKEAEKLSVGKETITFINRYRCKNGTYRWLSWNATSDLNNHLLYGIAMDITQMKETQMELYEAKKHADKANRTKTAFLANISHEVLTPLNGILAATSVLQSQHSEGDSAELLQIIKSSGEALTSMFHNLLSITRFEKNESNQAVVPFQLSKLFTPIRTHFAELAQKKGLQFVCECDEDLGVLLGDSEQLYQILHHLLDNAIKFTEKGHVHVKVEVMERSSDMVRLAFIIEDSGIGILEEDRQRIYEIFHQVDQSNTRRFGGVGLGLTMTKMLVEKLKGRIEFKSQPGQGTHFQVELSFGRMMN